MGGKTKQTTVCVIYGLLLLCNLRASATATATGTATATALQDDQHRRLSGLPPPAPKHEIAAAAAAAAGADHGFASFDTNHDGAIDRNEYNLAVKKLEYFLSDPSSIVPSSPSTWLKGFTSSSTSSTSADAAVAGAEAKAPFWPAFHSSVAMIVATEIGDKTFFIAAVLGMRNARSAVLLGALVALYFMTVLSTMMGYILPNLMPRQYTTIFGGLLFLYFGFKLINDSRSMTHKVSEELEEVEEELAAAGSHGKSSKKHDCEDPSPSNVPTPPASSGFAAAQQIKGMSWESTFIQSLSLSFLAEWGDRSQFATIALAAHKDPYAVTFGACLGHTFCTGMAVMGGRILASKISEKSVALGGGIIFLIFGVHSLFFET